MSTRTFQDLQKENERLVEENQKLKQQLTDLINRSVELNLRQVDKLNCEKKKLQDEVEELEKRLSSVTGQPISTNNPAIAALSDPYRPTKLVEAFGLLYDNQWTDAFLSFEKKQRKENDVINILAEIIKRADIFCTESFLRVTERIRSYLTDDICYPKVVIRKDGKDITCASRRCVDLESFQKDIVQRHINDLMRALAAVSGKQLADVSERNFMHQSEIRQSDS